MKPPRDVESARFGPHAGREMAEMFDDVSGRYDLLNRVMSLGQDGAWRAALARAVPDEASVVLDLCTGSGASLHGLRQPGRLLVGVDVSLGMLERAAERVRRSGWGPRLVCADGFRLPLRDASVDAVTIAFGARNLRPAERALAELARVIRPGGTLAVLEATAPGRSWFAPFHAFYLRHLVPNAGRLSRDPSAYAYLSRSIFEFGPGDGFESALEGAGFSIDESRAFLLGATHLWVARRGPEEVRSADNRPRLVHDARTRKDHPPGVPPRDAARETEWRLWSGVQLVLSAALTIGLAIALWQVLKSGPRLPLTDSQRDLAWWLLGGGVIAFGLRTVFLLAGRSGPRIRS